METRKANLYKGINAHLNSVLQNQDNGWKPFHTPHITYICDTIDEHLPPGYEAVLTPSLQIETTTSEERRRVRRPEPDVAVYETGTTRIHAATIQEVATPVLTLPALETLPVHEDHEYMAVEIRRVLEPAPVVRIELLSPTNKPPGEGYWQYVEKRALTLRALTPLIEMDYLHETSPVIERIPSYPQRQKGAYPYTITVTDPRPSLDKGEAAIYGFRVDDPFPRIPIPLAGEETLVFDFGISYQRTFERLRYFRNRVDYSQLPPNIESYDEIDRQRIAGVMMRATGQTLP